MSDKIYFTTGELANMLGVTKQTVIYYDRIGLISPAKRGEKEYRYYTLEQADELDSILTFRNLGVSIKMLKEYLSERNAERCIEMLKKQKDKVDMEIQKLDRIRKKIEGRSKLLEQVIKVKDFKKVEISAYETDLLSTLTNLDRDEYMKLIAIQVCKH
ncbi:MerR family transcriptional regulator [Clostridium sp. 19966]|uniref:MerR family transcriptional regulator n=1 Tax=Clostridium sp. 19966 TaxID=2768166 RepID=UPI0028DF7023|nr:MerR family transcriptional regulator [Clostridium sp. 19966]MDT8717394.1 MerR family transcriptional regulator [Clostridium sp. 19966]